MRACSAAFAKKLTRSTTTRVIEPCSTNREPSWTSTSNINFDPLPLLTLANAGVFRAETIKQGGYADGFSQGNNARRTKNRNIA